VAELRYLTSDSETAASQEPQAQPYATQITFVVDEAVEHVNAKFVSVHGNNDMSEVKVYIHSFLTSASDGGYLPCSHPGKTGLSTDKL
jgi:hypothetical protein